MPETTRLVGCLDDIHLEFVEREATPRLLMKLSIPLHLAGLSLSNIVSIFEIFGVGRARATVHNWVHKAELQPEDGRHPNHVAVDETVIQLDDEHYWLYAAVDPDTNELLRTRLEPTRTKGLAHSFFTELRDGATPLKDACRRHGLEFRYEKRGTRNGVERIVRKVKRRTSSFSNFFSNADAETADRWLRSFAFAWNQLV